MRSIWTELWSPLESRREGFTILRMFLKDWVWFARFTRIQFDGLAQLIISGWTQRLLILLSSMTRYTRTQAIRWFQRKSQRWLMMSLKEHWRLLQQKQSAMRPKCAICSEIIEELAQRRIWSGNSSFQMKILSNTYWLLIQRNASLSGRKGKWLMSTCFSSTLPIALLRSRHHLRENKVRMPQLDTRTLRLSKS